MMPVWRNACLVFQKRVTSPNCGRKSHEQKWRDRAYKLDEFLHVGAWNSWPIEGVPRPSTPARSSTTTIDLANFSESQRPPKTALELRPEAVKAYRNKLRRAREHASLPRQDELAQLAIGTCIDILSTWRTDCLCTKEPVNGGKRRTRVNALCQSCKHVHWVLTMFVDLEKLVTDRIKIDAGLLKLSAERVSGADDLGSSESLNAVEIIRAYHNEAQQAPGPVEPAVICNSAPTDEETMRSESGIARGEQPTLARSRFKR